MFTKEWMPAIIQPCGNHSRLPISLNCERFVLCFQKECNIRFYVVCHSASIEALSCEQLSQQQNHMRRQYISYIQTLFSWTAFVCHKFVPKVLAPSCQPTVPLTTRSTNLVRPRSLIIGGSSTTCKPRSKASWTSVAVVHGTYAPTTGAMLCRILHDITEITTVNNIRILSPQLSCDVSYN